MAFDRLICMPLGVGSNGHDGTSCCNHVLIISKWTWHSTLRFIKYLWRIICIRRAYLCVRVLTIDDQLTLPPKTPVTLAKCLVTISLASTIYFRICMMCVSYSSDFTCFAFIHSFCFDWCIDFIKNWSIESIRTLNNFALLPVHFFIAWTL